MSRWRIRKQLIRESEGYYYYSRRPTSLIASERLCVATALLAFRRNMNYEDGREQIVGQRGEKQRNQSDGG